MIHLNFWGDQEQEIPILAQGKTKTIYEIPGFPGLVRIVNRDDLTAGDGARRITLPGKGAISTRTTCNVFKLLSSFGIPNDLHIQDTENSFVAEKVKMVPLECVARGRAFGSYLKRHPNVEEGTRFSVPAVEFYLKDDARHDPMAVWNNDSGLFDLFNPKDPVETREPIGTISGEDLGISLKDMEFMYFTTGMVYSILKGAWGKLKVDLVDVKMEFGRDSNGNLMVADVIDNDSWRIWPGGDKSQMLDKQVFRDNLEPTEDDLVQLRNNYLLVAERTDQFELMHDPGPI